VWDWSSVQRKQRGNTTKQPPGDPSKKARKYEGADTPERNNIKLRWPGRVATRKLIEVWKKLNGKCWTSRGLFGCPVKGSRISVKKVG
jgi:hypothetical protein